jgi:hypothetical protein
MKGRSYRDAGIRTAVSEPVYPGDILAEKGWALGSNALRGAWAHTLLTMWREKVSTIEMTVTQWARAWNVSESEALRIIEEMEAPPHVCKVRRGACRDLVAPVVALTCRRLERRHKVLKHKAKAKRDERAAKASAGARLSPVVPSVAGASGVPSSSSSSSSSFSSPPSSSGNGGDEGGKPIPQTPEETAAKLVEQEASRKPDTGTVRDYSVHPPTLAECMAAAVSVGMREADVKRFMAHYGAQGWLFPNRLAIRSLPDAMGRWKAIQADRDARANKQAGDGGHVPAEERAVTL